MLLPVNEIFPTIQGEGRYTGTPAWFVRLQGCPVGCGWCDTKHTWLIGDRSHRSTQAEILAKDAAPSPHWASFDERQIVDVFKSSAGIKHVVITGGEPCLNDLTALTGEILADGMEVQIETSCTEVVRATPGTWVTGSPKFSMPGNLDVREASMRCANEIKFPVGKRADIDTLIRRVVPYVRAGTPIYLQPLSQSPSATRICIEAAQEYGFNVSIQTHKYVGIR